MRGYIALAVSVLALAGVQAQENGTKVTGDELSALVTGRQGDSCEQIWQRPAVDE
jgi:hypothetical protein